MQTDVLGKTMKHTNKDKIIYKVLFQNINNVSNIVHFCYSSVA